MIPKKILENGGQLNLRLNTENKELSKQVKKKHQVLRILEKKNFLPVFFLQTDCSWKSLVNNTFDFWNLIFACLYLCHSLLIQLKRIWVNICLGYKLFCGNALETIFLYRISWYWLRKVSIDMNVVPNKILWQINLLKVKCVTHYFRWNKSNLVQ